MNAIHSGLIPLLLWHPCYYPMKTVHWEAILLLNNHQSLSSSCYIFSIQGCTPSWHGPPSNIRQCSNVLERFDHFVKDNSSYNHLVSTSIWLYKQEPFRIHNHKPCLHALTHTSQTHVWSLNRSNKVASVGAYTFLSIEKSIFWKKDFSWVHSPSENEKLN